MHLTHIVYLAGAVGLFVYFAWAIQCHFTPISKSETPRGLRFIKLFGMAFVLLNLGLVLIFPRYALIPGVIGFCLLIGSLWVFQAAINSTKNANLALAYSRELPPKLVSSGPYKLIRHPFYTSYTLFWASFWFFSDHPLIFLSAIVMGALYIQAARLEEKDLLSGPFGSEYQSYRDSTKAFVPFVV